MNHEEEKLGSKDKKQEKKKKESLSNEKVTEKRSDPSMSDVEQANALKELGNE